MCESAKAGFYLLAASSSIMYKYEGEMRDRSALLHIKQQAKRSTAATVESQTCRVWSD